MARKFQRRQYVDDDERSQFVYWLFGWTRGSYAPLAEPAAPQPCRVDVLTARNLGQRPAPSELPRPCEMCGYDLRGLPIAHQCPECGTRFDDSLLLLVERPRRPQLVTVLRFLLGLVWLVCFGSFCVLDCTGTRASLPFAFMSLILLPIILILARREKRTQRKRRPNTRWAVHADISGVHIEQPGQATRRIEWVDLDAAAYDPESCILRLFGCGGEVLLSIELPLLTHEEGLRVRQCLLDLCRLACLRGVQCCDQAC